MNDIDMTHLREQVKQSVKKRRAIMRWVMLGVSVVIFGIFMLIIWGSVLTTTGLAELPAKQGEVLSMALIMSTLMGGLMLFYQLLAALSDSGAFDERYQRESMSSALSRELLGDLDDTAEHKRKNHLDDVDLVDELPATGVALSDDGELVRTSRP